MNTVEEMCVYVCICVYSLVLAVLTLGASFTKQVQDYRDLKN